MKRTHFMYNHTENGAGGEQEELRHAPGPTAQQEEAQVSEGDGGEQPAAQEEQQEDAPGADAEQPE